MIIFNGKKVNRNDYITKNFKYKEFQCKDGNKNVVMDIKLINKLQELRDWIKTPIIITSAYRTKTHNKNVKGSKSSYHLQGKAVDIVVTGFLPKEIGAYGLELGFKGIGVYKGFTHLDIRDTTSYWGDTRGINNIPLINKERGQTMNKSDIEKMIDIKLKPSLNNDNGSWGLKHYDNIKRFNNDIVSEYRGNDYIKRSEVFKIVDILIKELTKPK